MLRYDSYDIVFQEIPGEVTLAVNLSNCPNRCKGCHSPHLQEDHGEILDEQSLISLIKKYESAISCLCFMGGDNAPDEVERLAAFIRKENGNTLKTAWYSGKSALPSNCDIAHFNYIKLGPYIETLGGLKSLTTNQRFYRIEEGKMLDITYRFQQNIPRPGLT